MNEPPIEPVIDPASDPAFERKREPASATTASGTASAATASLAAKPADAHALPGRWIAAAAVLLAALSAAAVVYAWNTQQRVKGLEQQLVKRQEDSGAQAAEAQMLAKQANDSSREAAAKMALLEARVAEATLQRSQLEELIQSLSRSRDENLLADVEASIRVALQQTAITGSAEPLVVALTQAEERLARQNQPRVEGVRRAIVQDLDRVRVAAAVDLSTLAIRLDEAVRLVDELPLLSAPERRAASRPVARQTGPIAASAAAGPTSPATSGAAALAGGPQTAPAVSPDGAVPTERGATWAELLGSGWSAFGSRIWDEVRGLIRVTPIERPEAMLIAPEQAFFLRENLKLRLLNARLALLSRQFDTAQSDLRDALAALERYFDRSSKRTQTTIDLVRQVSTQAKQSNVPRPDATLAAIAAVAGGR